MIVISRLDGGGNVLKGNFSQRLVRLNVKCAISGGTFQNKVGVCETKASRGDAECEQSPL